MPAPDPDQVLLGQFGAAHGIRGDVMLDLRTDEPERRFEVGSVVRVEGSRRTLKVTNAVVAASRRGVRASQAQRAAMSSSACFTSAPPIFSAHSL